MSTKSLSVKPKSGRVYGKKYDPDIHIPLLRKVFSVGKGDHGFCAAAGICIQTLINWKKSYPEFKEEYQKCLSVAADVWEEFAMQSMDQDRRLNFNFNHWLFTMRSRGYIRNSLIDSEDDDGTLEGRLKFLWKNYIKGSISGDEFSKIVNAITGGLKAKELEITSKELDIKAKELEYQKERSKDMSSISDEALEAYELVKSGKGRVVKDE